MKQVVGFLSVIILLMISTAQAGYLMVKDVLSTSGGHLESGSYLLDYSTGQVAVGQSQGTSHIEMGGFWSWEPWGGLVGVEDEQPPTAIPQRYELAQNYPNPFNPRTHIRYHLSQAGPVALTVFNVMGQAVCRLVVGEQAVGEHVVTWDGLDDAGCPVASGIYFYQLVAGEFCQIRKMLLLK